MNNKKDKLSLKILKTIERSTEPLETREIEDILKSLKLKETITRTKVFYRLNILRGENKIKGKFVGSGKGAWIWWSPKNYNLRSKNEN